MTLKTPASTQQVTQQVAEPLKALTTVMSRAELMVALGLRDRVKFSRIYVEPALSAGLIELTQPNSPKSPSQKYRLTAKGKQLMDGQK